MNPAHLPSTFRAPPAHLLSIPVRGGALGGSLGDAPDFRRIPPPILPPNADFHNRHSVHSRNIWPKFLVGPSSHLIPSHLIPSHLISSHLISSHLASGRSSALHERGGITSDLSAPPVHLPKTFGAPPAHLQDISSTPPAHLQHTSSASPGNALTSAHCQFTRTSRAPPPISRPGWYRTPPLPTSHFPVPSSHFQFPLPVPTSSSHFPAPTPQFRPSLCNGPEPVWGVTGAIEGG